MSHRDVTPRVAELRRRMVTLPQICTERGKYVTESYRRTEDWPAVRRAAFALEHVLKNMSIRIEDGELLVGWQTSKTRGGALLPEMTADWVVAEMDTLHTRPWDPLQPLSEEERADILDFMTYWKGRSANEKCFKLLPPHVINGDVMVYSGQGVPMFYAHACGDYGKLLRLGLEGMTAELDAELAALEPTRFSDLDKFHLLQAMKTGQQAVIDFAERYAALAEKMAAAEEDTVRRAELTEIARICHKVPRKPADTFREALQSCWFQFVAQMIEGWGAGMSLGRLDQTLYPYYIRDLEAGRETEESVYELLCLLLVKMNGVINLQNAHLSQLQSGYPVMQGITVGGVDENGSDAVNALSYLLLDAEEAIGLTSEDLVVRIHHSNPNEFVVRACEVARNLHGKLKFVSDETTIKALVSTGVELADARDYISTGCHNPAVPAKSHDTGGDSVNAALILEMALNNGVVRWNGEQLGPATGDPRDFSTFEELVEAYHAQAEYQLRRDFVNTHARLFIRSLVPTPLLSSTFGDCIRTGRDITANGTKYRTYAIAMLGIPNVADSLAALKKTVFEDKSLTMDRVLRLLENDLEGDDEALYLLNRAPKFGNNDPYVDDIARDVLARHCDFIQQHESFAGIKLTAACLAMTVNIPMGRTVGALPDGRKAGLPLSEGGISPYQGRNVAGLTSTLASVAHLDHTKLSHGAILNVRVSGEAVKNRAALEKFARLLRTYCEMGGNLVQFNFVNNATLRAAQKEPEQYRDLLVRVATYSAYFTELSPDVQEDLIRRTEFESL